MPSYVRAPKGSLTFDNIRGKIVWATTGIGNFVIARTKLHRKNLDGGVYEEDQEPGNDVIVYFPRHEQRGGFSPMVSINLTDLTEEEFRLFRKIFATALKEAEPVIKARDADARSKLETGEIAPARAYRTVPRLFTPNGEVK